MKPFSLLLFSILLSAAGLAQSGAEPEVTRAVENLVQAMLDADSAKLVSLVRNELSYGHSSSKIEDKASFVGALASGRSDFLTMNITGQTIAVVNNTAMVRHLLTGTVVDNGKQGDVKLHVLLVWVKERGRWQLLARQAVKVP